MSRWSNRDLLALQKLGGWKYISKVEPYAHVNTDELEGRIDSMPVGKKLAQSA